MNRLDKRKCDICGRVIDTFGYMRFKDGSMCTECAKLISPHLKNRADASADFLKRHIAYRKENLKKLDEFKSVARYGYDKKIYIDSYMYSFLVTNKLEKDIKVGNPDVISLTAVKSCETIIREHTKKDLESSDTKHYYDFTVVIKLDSEWFDEIRVNLNADSIEGKDNRLYHKCESDAKELKDTLMPDQSFAANVPPFKTRSMYRL